MSNESVRTLDPLRFPLSGSRLIEASAGTGKTYTIAALYVRLVLGHGEDAAFARALVPPEILVVTFTEAATRELRDRIRARLAEAAACFLAAPDPIAAGDDLLLDLRAAYPPEAWPGCARKLQLAAEWMDEAAVSTIHAWCHRMLREHAFDSGSLFTRNLETDQTDLFAVVVRDYWRLFHYPLDVAAAKQVWDWWPSPDALRKDLRRLSDHAEALDEAPEPAVAIRNADAAKRARLAEIKAPWAVWLDELETLLDDAVAAKRVVASKLQRRYYVPWLSALREWCADPAMERPALDGKSKAWERLTPGGLAEIWKDGTPPDHPALHAIARLRSELSSLPDARADLLRFAARWVSKRFADEQSRRAQMGFNDLLTELDDALRGANGARLAALIREQFPVAMIDEFQDTDPVQYRIFDAIYRIADSRPENALILIGDPKQAIYGFRGADIHTYLSARRATGDRLYTLGTNFRSTEAMVAAVNHCFGRAEDEGGPSGAFLFRREGENPVPFHPVAAKGRGDVFTVDGEPVPALTHWCMVSDKPGAMSRTDFRERASAAFATGIVRLLNLGAQGRAGFRDAAGALRALRPADVAVLVNDGLDATAVRGALAARGVRSVYLSDKGSVFESAQAAELQGWLAACAEPDDARLLRAALASATLGLDWAALDALARDEREWEARVLQFRDYRRCWREQGVLPMLRRLLADFAVPARLLGARDGERALTDLLHLAELLQQASAELEGEHALVRHLATMRQDAGGDADARRLRLESDADLVQVVTVHKSKGLEYALVFLPFASAFRPVGKDDLPLKWHDDDGRAQVSLVADAALCERADRERLGEDLRKLYVALTRARHAVWVGVAPLEALHRGALGHLLEGGAPIEADRLPEVLERASAACADIVIAAAPEPRSERFAAPDAGRVPGLAREPLRAVREHWWVASYSGLRTGAAPDVGGFAAGADTAIEDVFAETIGETTPVTPLSAVPLIDRAIHRFPRGAGPGTFLHELLEWAAAFGFARIASEPVLVRDAVERRCATRGWSRWTGVLTDWLTGFVAMPLASIADDGDDPPCLASLGTCYAEMEFWFETRHVDAARLDELASTHTLGGTARPVLLPADLNGMLKGFIDLVFEHRGRYYVADYKSNWLGPDDGAYTSDAMRELVADKRYDLQYVIYLFALHRLLKARLPDYDYTRHVGGALYLFLRGSRARGHGLHFERPPYALIAALEELFAGRSAEQGAAA